MDKFVEKCVHVYTLVLRLCPPTCLHNLSTDLSTTCLQLVYELFSRIVYRVLDQLRTVQQVRSTGECSAAVPTGTVHTMWMTCEAGDLDGDDDDDDDDDDGDCTQQHRRPGDFG